jgi:hypothetical protein
MFWVAWTEKTLWAAAMLFYSISKVCLMTYHCFRSELLKILSDHLNSLSLKEFLCQVSFMTKNGKHEVRFAKSIWDSKKRNLRASEEFFKNVPMLRRAEFAKESSDHMWYKRSDSGDCSRRPAYNMNMKSIPEVLFKCIGTQLRTVSESTQISRETNIKDLLDRKFSLAQKGIVWQQ